MSFTRRTEDFTCAHCGGYVTGSGYTNHCPKCLWSRHVDINPGDRAENCGGMMEPLALEGSTSQYRIVHRCTRCGIIRRIDVSKSDDPGALLALSARHGTITNMTESEDADKEDKIDTDKSEDDAVETEGRNPLAAEESIEEDDRGSG